MIAEEHDAGKHKPDTAKRPNGGAEGLFLAAVHAVCVCLRDQAGQCHRKPRRGNGKEDVIYIVCGNKNPISVIAENIAERDLVDHAECFHDQHADRQDRRTVHKVLFLFRRRLHFIPPR